MSPTAGARHRVGDLRGRADLDLHDPRRRELVRRRAAHRRRHRVHLQPDPRRRPRGRHVGRLPRPGRPRSPRRTTTTVVLELKKPNSSPAAAADPDRPRARLEGRLREGGEDLHGRARGRAAGRRVRAVPAGRGQAGGSTYRFEANPDYWEGAPHIDEVVFRVYKSRRPDDPGADQGRGRLRRGHHRASRSKSLEGQRRHHRPQRRLTRASTRSRSTPAPIDTETGKPMGDGNPALQGPGLPARARLRHRPRRDHRAGLPGRR